jgi:hypothetical protein
MDYGWGNGNDRPVGPPSAIWSGGRSFMVAAASVGKAFTTRKAGARMHVCSNARSRPASRRLFTAAARRCSRSPSSERWGSRLAIHSDADALEPAHPTTATPRREPRAKRRGQLSTVYSWPLVTRWRASGADALSPAGQPTPAGVPDGAAISV